VNHNFPTAQQKINLLLINGLFYGTIIEYIFLNNVFFQSASKNDFRNLHSFGKQIT